MRVSLRSTCCWPIIAVAVPFLAKAQSSKVVYPTQTFWSKVEINDFGETGKWGYGVDGIIRRKNEFGEGSIFMSPMRESIRPWAHYQFSPYARFSLSPLGYMNTTEYVAKPEDTLRAPYHELRTTFQFFHHQKVAKGRVMHTWRYRYELRWQEQPGRDEYRYTNRFRFRYRIRYLLNSDDFYADKTMYLMASNEIGINIGRNVVYNTFNQNRLYLGVGMRFLTAARVELRYVDRFRTRGATGYEFDLDRGLMVCVYVDQLRLLGSKDIPQVRFYD
ncbi:MAG: DUF2490 domain-containing protein [Flavobacteriales bacterium]|nr:DUF2490 domain-containing protein [Flavobacteriales bacterium]